MWNNFNDLDLHVVTPRNERIFFAHRMSMCGGHLDVDRNAGGPATRQPVENIFWLPRNMVHGNFAVFVHHFAKYDLQDETAFEVHVLVDGKKEIFTGAVRSGDPAVMVAQFKRSARKPSEEQQPTTPTFQE